MVNVGSLTCRIECHDPLPLVDLILTKCFMLCFVFFVPIAVIVQLHDGYVIIVLLLSQISKGLVH